MVRFLSNVPIFRRLIISFAVAAAIPAVIVILLGNFYISSLTSRSQAVQTSFDAQSLASQEQVNLQRMNALLQTRFNEISASLEARIADPALGTAGGLLSSTTDARAADS